MCWPSLTGVSAIHGSRSMVRKRGHADPFFKGSAYVRVCTAGTVSAGRCAVMNLVVFRLFYQKAAVDAA